MAFAFDTLSYSKRLRAAGVAEEQAEAHAEAARDFIMTELVTKADLYAVRSDLKAANSELKSDLDALKADLKSDYQSLEAKLFATKNELQASIDKSALQVTVRFGGIVAVGIGILAAIQRVH